MTVYGGTIHLLQVGMENTPVGTVDGHRSVVTTDTDSARESLRSVRWHSDSCHRMTGPVPADEFAGAEKKTSRVR